MLLVSVPGFSHQQSTSSILGSYSCNDRRPLRYGFDWSGNDFKGKKNKFSTTSTTLTQKKRRLSFSPLAATALANTQNVSPPNVYQEIFTAARERFTQEISFQSKDKDVSLAKALMYVAAEDEAFMAFNRDMDAHSLQNERRSALVSSDAEGPDCLETMLLAGKSIDGWLVELDAIAKEVEAELVSRDIGCHLVEVLEAVNIVLFHARGFKRSHVLVDSKYSYLQWVLNSRCGSAILLSIIYIEVCRRLNLSIVGSRVGEEFLIWPQTGNPEELFKVTSGHSLFGIVNGRCVEDPRSRASDLNSNSLMGLDIATNRDIIGIALANLIVSSSFCKIILCIMIRMCHSRLMSDVHALFYSIGLPIYWTYNLQRLHWKRASKLNHGLMLTAPLRPVHDGNEKCSRTDSSSIPLLRPQELRLAIMASERLLILQPHNWALRRDHGMMLYYSREYGEAVQELSICMAFAPEEEAEILEPFVERLHLLRLESSWKSFGRKGRLKVP